ncbi:hypothetical protein ACHAW6_002277 [Cyclotella cf. meneghiniana]
MEKEMFSIVATLEEFRDMLLGADLHAFADHKNLIFEAFNMQHVLIWQKIEEFPLPCISVRAHNIVADITSWLCCFVTSAQVVEGKCHRPCNGSQ